MKTIFCLALSGMFLFPPYVAAEAAAAPPQAGTWIRNAWSFDAIQDDTNKLFAVSKFVTDQCHTDNVSNIVGYMFLTKSSNDAKRPFDVNIYCQIGTVSQGDAKATWRLVRFNKYLSVLGAVQKRMSVFLGLVDMGGNFTFAITRDPTEMGDLPIK